MTVIQQATQARQRVRIPLKLRLKAWWDGNDLLVKQRAAAPKGEAAPEPDPDLPLWDDGWTGLVQAIWGPGMVSPGDRDYIHGLVGTFGLNPAMSVLDLGAGLGGVARLMAEKYETWVTALEADPELVRIGMEMSIKAGMGKRAPVEPFDPESFELKEGAYDCVFSKDILFAIENKGRVLDQIDYGLKDNGQILFTDFVKPDIDRPGVLDDWLDKEPRRPMLWAAKDYANYLRNLGYDVRIVEDISERYHHQVVQRWADFLGNLRGRHLAGDAGDLLVEEVELWTRRMHVLSGGAIRVFRFHALKKGNTMSVSEV